MTRDPSMGPHVVYIAGFGRSGSTLLERLLGARPGWTNVGELVDLPRSVTVNHERCGCGEPFDDCPLWSAVGERAFGGWDTPAVRRLAELRLTVGRQRQLPRLLLRGALPTSSKSFSSLVREYQEGYGAIYRAVQEVTGCDTIVDASKGPAHGVALAGAESYSLSMLNLVRDPRAVAYSWSRRSLTRTQATGAPEEMWRISAARSAAQWTALQSEIELVRARGGFRTGRLTYEDLVEQPAAAISAALSDLGITTDAHDLPHIAGNTARLGASHGLSGNPGRYDTGDIILRADSRWRTGLPLREQRIVTALCLPLLTAYGYPVGSSDALATPARSTP